MTAGYPGAPGKASQVDESQGNKTSDREARHKVASHGTAERGATKRGAAKSSGAQAEQQAQAFLVQQGLTVLATNWHCPFGEVDLICQQHDLVIMVEVKQRSQPSRHSQYGGAAAAVTPAKQRKLIKTAECWLAEHDAAGRYSVRFDVVLIEAGQLQWLPAAFIA